MAISNLSNAARCSVMETKKFWKDVADEEKPGLSRARGCYIFSIRHGEKFTPWYVGKAETTQFFQEVFNTRNQEMCHDIMEKSGEFNLFLLPRLTPITGKFGKSRESRHIQHLELLLISYALKQNEDLFNVHYAAMQKELEVPGLFNNSPGRPRLEVQDLKSTLGL